MFEIIAIPFQYILKFFNMFFGNYSLAILIFTVVINLCLIPLNIKQQKSTAKQARLKPKLDQLKEKFGDDRMKYSTAMNELYQREGVSLAGGCLPMLIRMPILMGVYFAVRKLVEEKNSDFTLFGFIDLSEKPSFSFDIINDARWIWLIPFLSFVTSLLSMYISNKQQKKNNPQMQTAGNSMMSMMLIFPLISLWITFSVEGAVGFYWVCSNIVNTCIQLLVNHYYSVDKIIAKETAEKGIKRRKLERERINAN